LLRYILLGLFVYLLWRAVRPYVVTEKAAPRRVPKAKEPERIGGRLPHEVLGVRDHAPLSEVQDAYRKLVREVHPDKVDKEDADARARAHERTKQINRAYEILSKRRP
jgi:DnaJ-class molecular chaperone